MGATVSLRPLGTFGRFRFPKRQKLGKGVRKSEDVSRRARKKSREALMPKQLLPFPVTLPAPYSPTQLENVHPSEC